MGIEEHCWGDGSCSGMYPIGCRILSHEQCDSDLARRDFSYAFVVAQEKIRNYLSEAMEVYNGKYRIVVG